MVYYIKKMKTMNIVIIVGLTLFLILYLIYNPFILEGLAQDENVISNIELSLSKMPQQSTDPKIIGQILNLHKQLLVLLDKILGSPKFTNAKSTKTQADKAKYVARRVAVAAKIPNLEKQMVDTRATESNARKTAANAPPANAPPANAPPANAPPANAPPANAPPR